jgi:transcriptional regulator with GAF, ATPase, and Fis domain
MRKSVKDIQFNISLYIIIPIIFGGISVISVIVAYNLTRYFLRLDVAPERYVFSFGTIMLVVTFIVGLLIARRLLGPVEQFVLKTEQLGVLKELVASDQKVAPQKDDMDRYTLVFDQVTDLLSRVESQRMFPQIIGQSRAMRGVFNQILKVAATDSTVLILGETGTGKELISRSIHEHSKRSGKPFVALNCAAIPSGLLESELFGHERGAFTGADSRKLGKLEIASGGTVFLDEIGDMPLETQAKVLRVLQEAQFERVGGVRSVRVDIRFIAATNKDLSRMVEDGKFRQDLFFRLNVFSVHLPPLRERKEDIPSMVEEFISRQGKALTVSPETLQVLSSYSWPGNVRELQNVIESASVLAADQILPAHLPANLSRDWKSRTKLPDEASPLTEDQNLDAKLREIERGMIIEALTRCGGVQVKAARLLGIKERSLWHRIKKLDIDVSSLKP